MTYADRREILNHRICNPILDSPSTASALINKDGKYFISGVLVQGYRILGQGERAINRTRITRMALTSALHSPKTRRKFKLKFKNEPYWI